MDDKKLLFIVNPRAGKTKSLAPLFDACVCVTPNSARALPAGELAEFFRGSCREVSIADTVEDGVDLARDIAQDT